MGKLVPLLCAGAGAAAVSVGGVYLMKHTSFHDSSDYRNKSKKESKTNAELFFASLQDFKDKKGGSFTKEFFSEDVDFSSLGVPDSSGEIESTYFTSAASEDSDRGASRLSVGWERTDSTLKDSTEQKWKGTFQWLWNFKRGKKGFSMFVTTKPSDKTNTLDLEGGLYILEQKEDSSDKKWTIKKSKELSSTSGPKSLNSTGFDTTMPKAATDIADSLKGVDSEKKSYWGFVKDKSDLGKVCKKKGASDDDAECPASPDSKGKQFRVSLGWTPAAEENTGKKLSSWSTNFEQWAPIFFNNGTGKFKEALDGIKGTWKVD